MYKLNFLNTHIILISTNIILYYILLCPTPIETRQLTCACNECPDSDQCITSDHNDSTCFKSVERYIENNTYVNDTRYGCLSASDLGLTHLQCEVNTRKHHKLIYMACCKDDFCNQDLRDPTSRDDPRWADDKPPIETQNQAPSNMDILMVVGTTIIVFTLFISLCALFYKISNAAFDRYREKPKQSSESQDSICSFKVDFDQLKNQFMSHHHNLHHPHIGSSSASTRTYSESDYLSQKPDSPPGGNYPTIEDGTSTLPDFTSGVGPAREFEPRTMARVVQAGEIVPVGSGRFGRVFKGTYHSEDVAVKAFRSVDEESFIKEEKILKRLNHENIVRFIASETHEVGGLVTETWMFLEFCPYGSLCDYLDANEICGPQQAVKILFSVIRGLHYLHEDFSQGGEVHYKPPIAHRDLKSKNILMKSPDTCCIADFGHAVAKVNLSTLDFGGYPKVQVGTVRYMAPEILQPNNEFFDQNQFYSYAQADIYQFGLIMWEISQRTALDVLHPAGSHRLPYDGVVPQNPDIDDMIKIVCEDNYRPPVHEHWTKHPWMNRIVDLMVECWRRKPVSRPEALGAKRELKKLYDLIV